jgi:hypothetical protein
MATSAPEMMWCDLCREPHEPRIYFGGLPIYECPSRLVKMCGWVLIPAPKEND